MPCGAGHVGVISALALIWASLGMFNAVTSAVNESLGVETRRSLLEHPLVALVAIRLCSHLTAQGSNLGVGPLLN